MDYLSLIKQPIEKDLNDFVELFNESLTHKDGLLGSALSHIRQRGGKRMRPILILLTAKNFGAVSDVTQNAAVGLELLHTASVVPCLKLLLHVFKQHRHLRCSYFCRTAISRHMNVINHQFFIIFNRNS